MKVNERWRRASEPADRFSRFRRREPTFVGLVTALVALISLAIFAGLVELVIKQSWIAAILSIAVMLFIGYCIALVGNQRAKLAYIAEYRRPNNLQAGTDRKKPLKRAVAILWRGNKILVDIGDMAHRNVLRTSKRTPSGFKLGGRYSLRDRSALEPFGRQDHRANKLCKRRASRCRSRMPSRHRRLLVALHSDCRHIACGLDRDLRKCEGFARDRRHFLTKTAAIPAKTNSTHRRRGMKRWKAP